MVIPIRARPAGILFSASIPSKGQSILVSSLLWCLVSLVPLEVAGGTYYVDPAQGNDDAAGTSVDEARRSLKIVNATTFAPGDQILFKAGGAWSGQLHPLGSGSPGKPIRIGRYGDGPLPIFAGQGATEGPGPATVYLYNQEYVEIADLEITNYREGDDSLKHGVYILAEDVGAVHHIHLRNLFVHDVNGSLKTRHNGGIFLEVVGSTQRTWFEDVLIEGCHVRDVDRTGISNQSQWRSRSFEDDGNWTPNRNVVVRNNLIERAGQNGLIVRCSVAPLIEHNVFKDNGGKGTGNAMYCYNCDDALVQYNESYGTRFAPGEIDGSGFDSDYQSKNAVFQYNYSHDNDHGFILVCSQDRHENFNDGTIVRYNISENDGGNVFRISGKVTRTTIHNNVIYQGPDRDTRLIWHKPWGDGRPQTTAYLNNIFYTLSSGGYDLDAGEGTRFEGNLFYGNHPASEPDDPHKLTLDPRFVAPGEGEVGRNSLEGYQLKKGSPAIDSGRKIADRPPVDFWGNPVHHHGVPDRGAFEYDGQGMDASPVPGSHPPRVERVILFIIDGLARQAPERFPMPQLQKLAERGCTYSTVHLPLPGHPRDDPRYPWSCSMPNPMLMAGTPFIGEEGIRTSMIQHQFEPEKTAFIVNAYSYKDVSGGFGAYISHREDAIVITETKRLLTEANPVFLRVHLQRPGIEGQKCSRDKYADQHLGELVAWLEEQDLWRSTVLLVCGDHGQADEGWHEPYSAPSSMTTLVIAGAGVVPGRTVESCEIFDLAPTIAQLAGRAAPPKAIGRVLREAFNPRPGAAAAASGNVARFNEILRAAQQRPPDQLATLKKSGFLTIDDISQWHTTAAGTDFPSFIRLQQQLQSAR